MNQIEFKKTGNFWIDNGIVGLSRVLKELFEDKPQELPTFSYSLGSDMLTVSLGEPTNEDDSILSVLNAAKDYVAKRYLKPTGRLGWIYKNESFELYDVIDYRMYIKSFFEGKTPRTKGGLCESESLMKKKDRKMTDSETIAFQKFKEDVIKIQGKEKNVKVEGRGFLDASPKHELGQEFSVDYTIKGKRLCYFSGEKYKVVDEITGINYPFLTSKTGELNFASFLEGKPSISRKYAFITLFSFYTLHYQVQKKESKILGHYFLLYDSNLKSLDRFLNVIQKSAKQIKNEDYCNFETSVVGVQYEVESLFSFLLSVYKQITDLLSSDIRKELYSKQVFTLSNDGNIFRYVEEYGSLGSLFQLLDAFSSSEDEHNYFEDFLNFIRQFNQKVGDNKWDTTWRNVLCDNLLHFRSIHKVVERFLGEVKMQEENGGIPYLDKIISIYNQKTQLHMNAHMVEMCKSLGNRIGRYCRDNTDKGILFSIRNAKNRSEFLAVLSETQFRTEVMYSEEFFKELPDNAQWEEYKSLVSIFAMNSFLYDPNKKQSQPSNQ